MAVIIDKKEAVVPFIGTSLLHALAMNHQHTITPLVNAVEKAPCCLPDAQPQAGPAPPMPGSQTREARRETSKQNSHTLPDLIQAINKELGPRIGLAEASSETVEHLQSLMRAYVSRPDDWEHYAHWHPERYTRNLIDDGNGAYNLLLLCWPKGISRIDVWPNSAIHDHPESHCIMKIMAGDMLERRFAWPEGHRREAVDGHLLHHPTSKEADEMILTGETRLGCNDVAYMHDKFGLHQMVNSNASQTAVSLHLYSPPIPACKIFDPSNGACKVISSAKIDSKQGIRLASPTHEHPQPSLTQDRK